MFTLGLNPGFCQWRLHLLKNTSQRKTGQMTIGVKCLAQEPVFYTQIVYKWFSTIIDHS